MRKAVITVADAKMLVLGCRMRPAPWRKALAPDYCCATSYSGRPRRMDSGPRIPSPAARSTRNESAAGYLEVEPAIARWKGSTPVVIYAEIVKRTLVTQIDHAANLGRQHLSHLQGAAI
jgi:hypothetical protein